MKRKFSLCLIVLLFAGSSETLAQEMEMPPEFLLSVEPPANSFIIGETTNFLAVRVDNMAAFTNVVAAGTFWTNQFDLFPGGETNLFGAFFPAPFVEEQTAFPFSVSISGEDVSSMAQQPELITATTNASYFVVPRPDNDLMTNAFRIPSLGGIAFGTNHFASVEPEEAGHAGVSSAGASLWWKWSSPVDTPVLVDLAGTDFEGILGVYTGTETPALVEVVSGTNDVFNGIPPNVSFFAERGITYRIAVSSFEQPGDIIPPEPVAPPLPPGSDLVINPPDSSIQPDTGGVTGHIRLRVAPEATPDTRPPMVLINGASRTVIADTPEVYISGTARDFVNDSGVAGFLFLRNGSEYPVTVFGTSGDSQSTVEWEALFDFAPGTHVLQAIAVDFAGNRSESDAVVVKHFSPMNDQFEFSRTLPDLSGVETLNNSFSTREEGEPFHAINDGGHSVWFNWKAPTDGVLTLNTEGSDFDTLIAVYQGEELDGLTFLNNNDEAFVGSGYSLLKQPVVADEVYQIAVDGFGDETGELFLNYFFESESADTFLNVNIPDSPGGTVSPSGGAFPEGETITLTAMPEAGFSFIGWEGDISSAENPLSFVLLSDMTLMPRFISADLTDDFETGNLKKLHWQTDEEVGWHIAENEDGDFADRLISGGQFKAQSGHTSDDATSLLSLISTTLEGTGSFDLRVSCEEHWDYMEFSLNGEVLQRWSGEQRWINFQFSLPAGENRLEWVYHKDGSFSAGLDAAFIDNLYLPTVTEADGGTLSIEMIAAGVQLSLEGTPEVFYEIEASHDLENWTVIDRQQSATGSIQILDTEAPGLDARYYRARPE